MKPFFYFVLFSCTALSGTAQGKLNVGIIGLSHGHVGGVLAYYQKK